MGWSPAEPSNHKVRFYIRLDKEFVSGWWGSEASLHQPLTNNLGLKVLYSLVERSTFMYLILLSLDMLPPGPPGRGNMKGKVPIDQIQDQVHAEV